MKLSGRIGIIIIAFASLGLIALGGFFLSTPIPVTGLLWLGLFVGSVVVGSVALVLNVQRRVLLPVRTLSAAVTRVRLGDLSQTVPVSSHDEIGELSSNFNDMTRQLGVTQRTLQDASKLASERRAELESSINSLRQGFIIIDTADTVLLANTSVQEMLAAAQPGSNEQALTVERLGGIFPDNLHLSDIITQTLESREQSKFQALPLGNRFINLYLSPVINDTEVIGTALLLEDITEERILQRSRDEFFSIASHELRTPLTAIRGNAQMIEQFFPEVLKNKDLKEMVADIHESCVRLIEIVTDFLDVSRLEQGKMKFTPATFAVDEVIEQVIYEMAGLSKQKGIELTFDHNTLGDLPVAYADKDRVKQIIYNLIGNAMKFTDEGSVNLNILSMGSFLKICVTDTGRGISPEGQQLLFHKFQQTGDSILTRDTTRGTGLGLYISKLMVERMGGDIRLEHSKPGKGSTFSFTIPVANKEQLAARTPTELATATPAQKNKS